MDDYEIDSPLNLLPDLAAWGIDEVDKGICRDTAENRKIIRGMKSNYQPVYDSTGKLTDLIQVITPEMRSAAYASSKKILLKDDRDVDSDYITGIMLIAEPAIDNLAPAWVLAATRHWIEVADKRKTNPLYRPAIQGPPARCAARKVDGHRCANWTNGTVDYGDFCRTHLSNRPNGEEEGAGHLAKARNRLQTAASAAVDQLESLLTDATSEQVRLGAARDILDRAGIRGGIEVDQQILVVQPAADLVRERLEKLTAGIQIKKELEERFGEEESEEDVIDAEIVEDGIELE